jgi:hypothetical protein
LNAAEQIAVGVTAITVAGKAEIAKIASARLPPAAGSPW